MYLQITDAQIMYSDNDTTLDENIYNLNRKLDIKQNLQLFKNSLKEQPNVLILINPNESILKNNVIEFKDQLIDLGSQLEDIFHIPIVNQHDLNTSDLDEAAKKEAKYSNWHLDYYGIYHGKKQYGQESMQTLGNGYFGLRGTYFEAKANDDNYPATYVAGVFNQLGTPINKRNVINEDLVNLPNAQFITFRIDDGNYFQINEQQIIESLRSLDLKTGLFTITMIVQLDDGKRLKIVEKKVADQKNYHDYYLQYTLQPLNFSGKVTILTQTDASVINSNVERYRNLASKHLITDQITEVNKESLLLAHTSQSDIKIAVKTDLNYSNITNPDYRVNNQPEISEQTLTFNASENQTYVFEKSVAIFTSLECDKDIENVAEKHHFISFDEAVKEAQKCWHAIWKKENIKIKGDITAQKLLHLNIYNMTISAQINANKDLDASVGSRGLTGEGYRGHIFWDELFDINFYVIHSPELVKHLLMYRYNRLEAAKDYAADDGYKGAMYPWQSGMYGDEQSQEVHLNPITNKWDPDNSRKQRHVSLAVAYDILNYYNLSEDADFMAKYGLEMLLNISKFWINMTKHDEISGKYSISNVMGPDEFHEGYPGHDNEGLKNNAYTNIMVSWLFKQVSNLLTVLPDEVINENLKRSHFPDEDLGKLDDIRQNLTLDFQGDILGQFEGYFDLKTLDFDKYREQYGNISRMDRILKAHDDNPDNYQVAKQADTLMSLFNIREADFFAIMDDLGYPIEKQTDFISDNINYYIERTTHGSTLSRIVYSMLLLKVNDQKQAWKLFYEALTSDYYDIQGGTTAEGIHLGVMGATLNVVTSYFAGVDYRGDMLEINPNVPKTWQKIAFKMTFKNINFHFEITKETIAIKADQDTQVNFLGKVLPLVADQEIELTY